MIKNRVDEIESLLNAHPILDFIGDACHWEGSRDEDGFAWGVEAWKDKLEDYVKLRIEKHDILMAQR